MSGLWLAFAFWLGALLPPGEEGNDHDHDQDHHKEPKYADNFFYAPVLFVPFQHGIVVPKPFGPMGGYPMPSQPDLVPTHRT